MRLILFFSLFLMAFNTNADIGCTGNVTLVMEWPDQCGGNLAYFTDNSNGKWFCSLSEKSGSLVLAALASGKKVTSTLLESDASSCSTIAAHYLMPRYIIIRQ